MRRQAAEEAQSEGGKSGKTQLPLPSFPFLSDRPTATGGLTAISPLRITVIIAIENSKV